MAARTIDVRCPWCHAAPGKECVDKMGNERLEHKARQRAHPEWDNIAKRWKSETPESNQEQASG